MMILNRLLGLTVIAALCAPPGARAQDPAQRLLLEQFRDSLAAQTDTAALLAGEQRLIAVARVRRDSTVLHLRLGFLAYRLGELTGVAQHYDDAGSEFEWAADLQPAWPYPWYGLGLAELALGEHRMIALENLRQVLGQDYLSKAVRAFARAAQADPAFGQAVIDLAHTAMRQRVGPRLDVARDALREAAATPAGHANPALHLARGRVEREVGEGDSAVAAFRAYLAVGGDSGVGLLEIARSQFFLRRAAEATSAFYAAAARRLSPDAVAAFRSDLAWIAAPGELAAFDSLAPGAHRAWLERFWARRDAEDGRRRGERIAEHYRRYFYAVRHYHLVSRHPHYDVTERFRSEQDELDDRGVIYLRHGEPDRRATFSDPAVEPNESWLYVRPAGSLIFHFVAREDVADYKLVESLADAYGFRAAVALGTTGGPSTFGAALFESRAGFDPVYQRLGSAAASSNRGTALAAERARGHEALRVGTTTDSYALHFDRSLVPVVRDLVVGGAAPAGERATLLLPFALSGAVLTPEQAAGVPVYRVGIRLAARDADGRVFVRDTVRVFSAGRVLDARDQLNGLETLDLPAGVYHVRVVLQQPETGAGSALALDSVVVPRFGGGDALTLSDVLVGRREDGLAWQEGSDTVPVSATVTYPAGSSVDVYFEVHGLQAGARYRSRIEIERDGGRGLFGLFGRRRTPVSLAFDAVADTGLARVRQTLNLGSLGPGRYRLQVTVETPAGDARHARPVILTVTPRTAP